MTPDCEPEGSEQGVFFFGMEGNIEDAQSVCLHRHGLLHSAQQLNLKGDKSGAWRLALQCREDSEIEPRNFKLKTLTRNFYFPMDLFARRSTLAVAFIALIYLSASAQQVDRVLTLQDCLRLAESAPSTVSVAEQQRAIADRDLTRARAAFMPQAEMLNGFIYNSPRLDDRSTFSFLPANGVREYTTFGAVTQEFDTSGRLRAELQRARAGQDAARVNFEIARRDLRSAVTIAYYRLLLTRHLVTVVGGALKESQSFESRAKLLFEGGEAARADLVKASAQVAFLRQALNAAELEAKLANQELASFWTKEVDEPLRIADAFSACRRNAT